MKLHTKQAQRQIQKRVYFKRLYDDAVMTLPADKPASFYATAIRAEWRVCSLKEYRKGLKRRKLLGQKSVAELVKAA